MNQPSARRSHSPTDRSGPGAPRQWKLSPIAAALLAVYAGDGAANTAAALRARSGGTTATAPAAAVLAHPNVSAETAALRALRHRNQARAATDLALQAQAAARAAAAQLPSGVPNGLGLGALDPVANPQRLADDPTGLNTWQGAELPTQRDTAQGVEVNVRQNEERAILSWNSFNVGRETTLVFDQRDAEGDSRQDWVVLNRVVGGIDPATGRRDPSLAPAPSQILGQVKADGTVLVLNQNGVIFSPTAQVNVRSLVASSLDVGRQRVGTGTAAMPATIKDRNAQFQQYGLLGYADQLTNASANDRLVLSAQAQPGASSGNETTPEGAVRVEAGARIQSSGEGYVLLAAPQVSNAGHISASDGQVLLQAGRQVFITRASGAADSADPNVRGLQVSTQSTSGDPAGSVRNTAGALIEAPRGQVYLAAADGARPDPAAPTSVINVPGAVINEGVLGATTSVSRNGSVQLQASDVRLAPGSTIAIGPDSGGETIPQDPVSLDGFKPSRVRIGNSGSRVEIGSDSLLYVPGGDIVIGADAGAQGNPATDPRQSRIFIDSGAVIDAGGLKDVLVDADRNSIRIRPVTRNELRDTPDYRDGFLRGTTIHVDPRRSGVRDDGVAWIGSPLVEAGSYYEQVGVGVEELMVTGGNVVLGTAGIAAASGGASPDVIVKPGVEIDISGGWLRYEGGMVRVSRLVTADGRIVDVGNADPNDTYIALYGGFTRTQERWGISETWVNPLLDGSFFEPEYTEGRDAGSLTLKAPRVVLEGDVYGHAYAGSRQVADGQRGSGDSALGGDRREMQAVPSQLPAGGLLLLQGVFGNGGSEGTFLGGGDIIIRREEDYAAAGQQLVYGESVSLGENGELLRGLRGEDSFLQGPRLETTVLPDAALERMGLSQLSLSTSGQIVVEDAAGLALSPGGVFSALSGRALVVDGDVSVAGGQIRLETADFGLGSIFAGQAREAGAFDLVINGHLSAGGRWTNDLDAAAGQFLGSAHIDGGSIRLVAAPRVSSAPASARPTDMTQPQSATDLSGSILIGSDALLDVSSGGHVGVDGELDLGGRGGDVSLISETTWFQLLDERSLAGGLEGFRVRGNTVDGTELVPINPGRVNARIAFDSHNIRGHGFAGGGVFRLVTPEIAFGEGEAATGTVLSLDFFSESGFGEFEIRSNRTALLANEFSNNLGGFHALPAVQTLRVGDGETLRLSQSTFSPFPDAGQTGALRGLATGGDLYSLLQPSIPAEAWDRRAASLRLEGLVELHVESGGRIEGEAGSALTVAGLLNQGTIRLPGGRIDQAAQLLPLYVEGPDNGAVLAVRELGEILLRAPSGELLEGSASAIPGQDNRAVLLTNAIYLHGELAAEEGVRLAAGSVTDLSGISLRDPRAFASQRDGAGLLREGRLFDGGELRSLPERLTNEAAFETAGGLSPYQPFLYEKLPDGGRKLREAARLLRAGRELNIEPGATLDLSGVADTHDLRDAEGQLSAVPVWSAAGSLYAGGGGQLAGADIRAAGGAAAAAGGTLVWLDPVLHAQPPSGDPRNALVAGQIEAAGFDTLVALGSISAQDSVSLQLGRAFVLESRPYSFAEKAPEPAAAGLAPVVRGEGSIDISAPYIRFDSNFQAQTPVAPAGDAAATARFSADTIDVEGAVRFDGSFGRVELWASDELRLTGVVPAEAVYLGGTADSLAGELRVAGDLRIVAGQVYPTTASSFTIASAAGDIRFERSGDATPATPYSAGGNLRVEAANIVQAGVLRVPLGSLTLSATGTVSLEAGSLTSVSADGLSIPYGVTTDQVEWYFSPTSSDPLRAPPRAELRLDAADVRLQEGSTVDLSGGGDVFAYEFVPGVGGSRDVLDRLNPDGFSGNDGLQYPDGRQVYAIVPGLSDRGVAAHDPIYSADYADLGSATGVGRRVWLEAAPGLAAGWYTLLPAHYALLPGGMRLVERSGAEAVDGLSAQLRDGTRIVSGRYGSIGGSEESQLRLFDLQPREVLLRYSSLRTTSGNEVFAAQAARAGQAAPRLPQDAGRLVLNPAQTLEVAGTLRTLPATGGRGAQADIGGRYIDIVDSIPAEAPASGAVQLTADGLSRLGAASLLIGGVRTDNADGSTTLDLTAQQIRVANSAATPLSAPEIVLAVDGPGAGIEIADGATIVAQGTVSDTRDGDYLIDGGRGSNTASGAVLRVANGPERLVERSRPDAVATPAMLDLGAARLEGQSVLAESSGGLQASPDLQLVTDALAGGAHRVSFAADPAAAAGLVITPQLQLLLAQAGRLTLSTQTTVDFSGGEYRFGDLRIDGAGIGSLDGSAVLLNADRFEFSNRLADAAACGAALPCDGSASLGVTAAEIVLGPGRLQTPGFGGGVTLHADRGIYARGDSRLDAGSATLTLETPFLGDSAELLSGTAGGDIPRLNLATTGLLRIAGTGAALEHLPAGVAGASLALSGGAVQIDGTRLRATAGVVDIVSATDLQVQGATQIEAPGYARRYGDDADPVTQSSPAGRVRLVAVAGDLALGADSTLRVGGSQGRAGAVELLASEGQLQLAGRLDAAAPEGGGRLRLDTGAAFDLGGFAAGGGLQGFDGAIDVRAGSGDLALAAGQRLAADRVRLTADDGSVDIAGTIDVSGINGGEVALQGREGVRLRSGSLVDAHAEGHAADDSRRAEGGKLTLGTADAGELLIEEGARIDLSARRPEDRLIRLDRDGERYWFVRGDEGGELHLRAPRIEQSGADTVRASVAAGSVEGARAVTLEAYTTFDLADPALGVQIEQGVALLDPRSQAFLNDAGFAGGVVRTVQDFDVSASYASLGGLAEREGFHARPGIELIHAGDIRLLNPWNLAAGEVDLDAAVAGGAMLLSNGVYSTVAGQEARIFNDYTRLLYRTGGRVDGEAGILSLRAGGELHIGASLSDGFFQFRDQTDPVFLSAAIGGTAKAIPYSTDGNAASPLAAAPFGTAELFPLLSGGQAADSWSFRLVAGAVDGADPTRTRAGGDADLRVDGERSYTYGNGQRQRTVYERSMIRSGSGSIELAAADDVDLQNGAPRYRNSQGSASSSGFQVGGSPVYTAGQRARLETVVVHASDDAVAVELDPSAYLPGENFNAQTLRDYRYGTGLLSGSGQAGVLVANAQAAEDGGDIAVTAGGDVLGRRSVDLEAAIGSGAGSLASLNWVGYGSHPWRSGAVNTVTSQFPGLPLTRILSNPQLFADGIGTLGGGDIRIDAGRDVVDLTVAATNSLLTASLQAGGADAGLALQAFGHGDLDIRAGRDFVAGRLDVASGSAEVSAGRDIASAATVLTPGKPAQSTSLRILLADATVALSAGGSATLQGVAALGAPSLDTGNVQANLSSRGLYSAYSGLSVLANGEVSIANANGLVQSVLNLNAPDLQLQNFPGLSAAPQTVLYPGSLEVTSIDGDVVFQAAPETAGRVNPRNLILYPSPHGQLEVYAGGDIAPVILAMEDGAPGLLPGVFSSFQPGVGNATPIAGRGFAFPFVLPSTSEVQRQQLHAPEPTHADDQAPVRIYADGDIAGVTLSLPKPSRVYAGRDVINMMFFGQNLSDSDISRVVAGRDIVATTRLIQANLNAGGSTPQLGDPLPALQGNTFVIGGPGALFIEAGRDAGPFLNSAVQTRLTGPDGRIVTGEQGFGGGVLSVGNEWNPWLPEQGADLYVSFGVAQGADFAGLRDTYLDPANLAQLDDDLFEQAAGGAGELGGDRGVDRSRPIYGPRLVAWMQQHAAEALLGDHGGSDVSYEQAYASFKQLPELRQRRFLIDELFFNELAATSVPDGPSFQQYSRGYRVIETLYPAERGYTRNRFGEEGAGGAEALVSIGDLDLRLATIQTSRGGDIRILGPGGRVLGGSVVRTDQQAARRNYEGQRLFAGNTGNLNLQPPVIAGIPSGFEGILTLRGGDIASFTDADFLLNQSRLFTQAGGDITMWSSNGDLNAGQGPKTSANFPPVVVRIDQDGFIAKDTVGGVTGAGIAAFKPAPGEPDPSVFLIAPRGTVDAGDAGVRVAGNLFVAAAAVTNASNFDVGGDSVGIPAAGVTAAPAAPAAASAAANAAAQAAEAAQSGRERRDRRMSVSVRWLGNPEEEEDEDEKKKQQ